MERVGRGEVKINSFFFLFFAIKKKELFNSSSAIAPALLYLPTSL